MFLEQLLSVLRAFAVKQLLLSNADAERLPVAASNPHPFPQGNLSIHDDNLDADRVLKRLFERRPVHVRRRVLAFALDLGLDFSFDPVLAFVTRCGRFAGVVRL